MLFPHVNFTATFSTPHIDAVGPGTTFLLAAEMEASGTIGIFVSDSKVVKHIAVFFLSTTLATSGSGGADWQLIAHRPLHQIDTVDGLLYDVISGKPVVVQPVAHTFLHIRPILLGVSKPQFSSIIGVVDRHNLSNISIENALISFPFGEIIAPAKT